MILDRDKTKIHVEEIVDYDYRLTAVVAPVSTRHWEASLSGVSENGEEVIMSRNGNTPDEALKNLFEAMHEAEVWL